MPIISIVAFNSAHNCKKWHNFRDIELQTTIKIKTSEINDQRMSERTNEPSSLFFSFLYISKLNLARAHHIIRISVQFLPGNLNPVRFVSNLWICNIFNGHRTKNTKWRFFVPSYIMFNSARWAFNCPIILTIIVVKLITNDLQSTDKQI